ncbi:MAG: hypothetical protein C7B46_08380 [Sulfobacillus benefaciens]|uniref:P-type Cu(+) transporter n=1 Tax=Sulfobacillus benefaciens TaxID=453960 RepID=A0A2T2XHD7_9FIRM|nr:MAG: hypothetical protein C7B46_08380 [Sulfobacillus benefaciens]
MEGLVADRRIRVRTPIAADMVGFPSGMTIAVIEVDGVQQGWIALRDQLRPEAPATVDRLKKAGYQVFLVTGDQPSVAELVARETGCDAWFARQSPLEKAETVHKMQQAGHRVAFVGDGINDATTLIQSNLAIALAQGADIAVEAGHLTLSRSNLTTLPEALALAKKTSRVIRQNLFWALGYNVIAIPAAAVGLVEPVVAAGAMVLSSAFVLGNSLTLLGWSPRAYIIRTAQIAGFSLS